MACFSKRKDIFDVNVKDKYGKILVVGRGVIGTIYGYMLSRGGYDVTHLLKKDK